MSTKPGLPVNPPKNPEPTKPNPLPSQPTNKSGLSGAQTPPIENPKPSALTTNKDIGAIPGQKNPTPTPSQKDSTGKSDQLGNTSAKNPNPAKPALGDKKDGATQNGKTPSKPAANEGAKHPDELHQNSKVAVNQPYLTSKNDNEDFHKSYHDRTHQLEEEIKATKERIKKTETKLKELEKKEQEIGDKPRYDVAQDPPKPAAAPQNSPPKPNTAKPDAKPNVKPPIKVDPPTPKPAPKAEPPKVTPAKPEHPKDADPKYKELLPIYQSKRHLKEKLVNLKDHLSKLEVKRNTLAVKSKELHQREAILNNVNLSTKNLKMLKDHKKKLNESQLEQPKKNSNYSRSISINEMQRLKVIKQGLYLDILETTSNKGGNKKYNLDQIYHSQLERKNDKKLQYNLTLMRSQEILTKRSGVPKNKKKEELTESQLLDYSTKLTKLPPSPHKELPNYMKPRPKGAEIFEQEEDPPRNKAHEPPGHPASAKNAKPDSKIGAKSPGPTADTNKKPLNSSPDAKFSTNVADKSKTKPNGLSAQFQDGNDFEENKKSDNLTKTGSKLPQTDSQKKPLDSKLQPKTKLGGLDPLPKDGLKAADKNPDSPVNPLGKSPKASALGAINDKKADDSKLSALGKGLPKDAADLDAKVQDSKVAAPLPGTSKFGGGSQLSKGKDQHPDPPALADDDF